MAYRSDTLKEAIVNKLKDYDAYIDNELPDYILVMLANKKTVSQISQDLELFLGDNTSRFSKWLKEVLEKPELLSPTGQKRSIDALEIKDVPATETKPPQKRKIIVRSRKEEDKETNRSSTYQQLEIVHEPTTHEKTHHSSKQSDSAVSSDKEEEEDDEPVTTTLASVIKKPDRKPQPSGRILMKAISAIQGSNSGGSRSRSNKKAIKSQPDSSTTEQANEESKDVIDLLPGDLRKRLGKRNNQESAVTKSDEPADAADDTVQTERVVVRPKFVVTMNEVDEKYKSEPSQEELPTTEADEPTESGSLTGGKMPERCRYWPNCKNGDICPYHHPSIPCKLFPKCKFGDKCRFVHPICKFNAQCLKPGCPFLHTAPRRKQAMGPEAVALPSTGMMPSYSWNPKGSQYKSNQYVWSSKTHVSERKFVTTEKTTHMPVPANI
ncbi:zinc finger CCCH domain-containing protein 14-like [Dysidea avara]|uniref:zinc finger CCCH domain-containing protein 14-like n=1 Tax=Dysidea avara TaxID=196820 RepID=UPI0033192ABA